MAPRSAVDVIRDASRIYLVDAEDIRGPKRDARTCEARFAVIAALSDMGWSSTRIGSLLNRHHTAVLYALGRLAK